MHRCLDISKLASAQAQAAHEELPFSVQAHIGPASEAAARAAAHYTALAREAELLSALRQACAHIEYWAAGAFRRDGMSQEDFEFMWRAEELTSWALWERLKTVAGLPLTEPKPVEGCTLIDASKAALAAETAPSVAMHAVAIDAWKLRLVYFDADGHPAASREPEPEELRAALAEAQAPEQEPVAQPLTDEQIKAIWWQCEAKFRESADEWWLQFARAVLSDATQERTP